MFKSWKSVVVAVVGLLVLASVVTAARRLPNIDGVLFAGHDGTAQQIVGVDDNGNVSVEFGASGAAFTVGGPAADDAAASGNPVPVGCKYNTTPNTVEDGDISYLNCGTRGSLNVTLVNPDSVTPAALGAIADNTASGANGLYTVGRNLVYDSAGTNWDMARQVVNATDTTGAGIAATGLLAQCDDTAPTATTENQFGNVRRNCTTGALLTETLPSALAAPALSTCVILSLANTENETNCKASAANLYGFTATNNSAVIMYITFYNTDTATTCGTSEVMTYFIPVAAAGGQANIMFPAPINFTTGLSYCVGTAIDGTTAPAAGTGNVVALYK